MWINFVFDMFLSVINLYGIFYFYNMIYDVYFWFFVVVIIFNMKREKK